MDDQSAVAVAGITKCHSGDPRPMVVAGSVRAVAVARAQQVLMGRPPGSNRGDPAGPGGMGSCRSIPLLGLSPVTAPQTPYDSVIVNGEYDGGPTSPTGRGIW